MKIFVTVGSQLPFDRLIGTVDAWARSPRAQGAEVHAQVGETDAVPVQFPSSAELDPEAFREAAATADLIVGHAGTGTIMAALCAGKPVVVLARREALQETRNDHQLATIERFRHLPGFHGTDDAEEIPALMDAAIAELRSARDNSESNNPTPPKLGPHASGPIVDRLRVFLDEALS